MSDIMTTIETTQPNALMEIVGNMAQLLSLGETLVKSGLLPEAIKTKEAAVAIIIKGQELGLAGPMESFSSIHVINGKPSISAALMIALAERSGQMENYKITTGADSATCEVQRRGRSSHSETFTMDDAKAMQLTGKDNWKKQPANMLKWRAVSAAFRVVFADIIAGLYTKDELESLDPLDPEPMQETEAQIITPEPEPMPDDRPWIETAEGIRAHVYFDESKIALGEAVYYDILKEFGDGAKHRTDLVDQKLGRSVAKVMSEARDVAQVAKVTVAPKPEPEPTE